VLSAGLGGAAEAIAEAGRAVAADMLLSYVTGFVLQEQAESGAPPAGVDRAEFAERFPLTMRDGPAYGPDEIFRRSLRLPAGRRRWADQPLMVWSRCLTTSAISVRAPVRYLRGSTVSVSWFRNCRTPWV
jgi:hypothetical protein